MPTMKCLVPVEQGNYTALQPADVISIQLAGGAPRIRQDQLGATVPITVQWTVGKKDYDYLMAFYRQNKGLQFTIDLLLDSSDAVEYTATFTPGTFQLNSKQGLTFVLQATLDVIPLPIDVNGDLEILGRNS